MKYIVRFYGSCSHTVDTESHSNFVKANRSLREIGWAENPMYNIDKKPEVTVEGDKKIVHIHPLRYSQCSLCIKESMIIDQLEGLEQELKEVRKKIQRIA